jgi:hypothetical protein
MADPTVASELVHAIPVLIGGALAVLGGAGGQWLTHWLSKSRDAEKFRREKIEALVKALYAHEQWLEDRFSALVLRGEKFDQHSPLDEVRMLQALHFPTLEAALISVQQSNLALMKFVNEQQQAKLKNLLACINTWDSDPYMDEYKNYRSKVPLLKIEWVN